MSPQENNNAADTQVTKYPGDKPLDEKKHLWESFNYWYEQMLDRVIQYQQGLVAFRKNPTKTIPTQSGQLSIYNILERRKPAADEAIEYVQVLKEMLEAMGEKVPTPQHKEIEAFLNTDLPDPNAMTGAVKSPIEPGKNDEGSDDEKSDGQAPKDNK